MNGYINVELGGENRGIKFGNRALLDVMAKHQITGNIKFSFDLVVDLVFFGMVNNCMIKKQNPDFTEDQVTEWVDDMPMEKLLEIFNVFQASYSGEVAGEPTKKITKSEAAKKSV